MKKTKTVSPFFIILLVITAGLAVADFYIFTTYSKNLEKLKRERENLKEMRAGKRYLQRHRTPGKTVVIEDITDTAICTSLSEEVKKAGLPEPDVLRPEPPRVYRGWERHRFILDFKKGRNVERSRVVQFIVEVEKRIPFLKLQDLTGSFSNGNFNKLRLIFAYFRKKESTK
jgi:hypothetical protein